MKLAEEYKQHAALCERTDNANNASVRRHNRAATRMYALVDKAVEQGQAAIATLIPLLDDPVCAKWLAHHLLERAEAARHVELKCLTIIESLAGGTGPEAAGELLWLKRYKLKARRER